MTGVREMRSEEQWAYAIRDYWLARGYNIDVGVVKCSDHKTNYPAVRSNMINGLPRDYINHRDRVGGLGEAAA